MPTQHSVRTVLTQQQQQQHVRDFSDRPRATDLLSLGRPLAERKSGGGPACCVRTRLRGEAKRWRTGLVGQERMAAAKKFELAKRRGGPCEKEDCMALWHGGTRPLGGNELSSAAKRRRYDRRQSSFPVGLQMAAGQWLRAKKAIRRPPTNAFPRHCRSQARRIDTHPRLTVTFHGSGTTGAQLESVARSGKQRKGRRRRRRRRQKKRWTLARKGARDGVGGVGGACVASLGPMLGGRDGVTFV
jgi:hypothetical protein